MSLKLDNSFFVKISVSYFLGGALWFIHIGGIVLVGLAVSAWLVRVGLWALLGFSLYHAWRLHVRRTSPWAIEGIAVDSEETLSVKFHGVADRRSCRIISRFVHPWLVVLRLQVEACRWPVKLVIVVDAAEADSFRRLRAWLRLQSAVA